MRVAVIRFPGANCDQDAFYALIDAGVEPAYVWHEESSLAAFDAVFLPGGFTYGDYLRCGAIAARAPIMAEVHRFAKDGYPVIGACNGFQILCEAGILPGALLPNKGQKFVCRTVCIRAESKVCLWTQGIDRDLRIPIAHGEGQYVCDPDTLSELRNNDLVSFRYVPCSAHERDYNPNGSTDDIAGITNGAGNVLGLMPHPERATRESLGSTDGLAILKVLALVKA